jgi:uncharacterized protein (DUF427 family)
MLSPGLEQYPDHRVVVEPLSKRVEIFIEGEKVVETKSALIVHETNLDPVVYVPRSEIKDLTFKKIDDYHCPFKGRAELYSVKHGASEFENAAWAYEAPYDDYQELKGYIAFHSKKVQHIRITG